MKYDDCDLDTLFRMFFYMYMSFIKREFEKKGVNPAGNPRILFILRHEADNMAASQKEIADKLGVSAPTIAISIKRMEKAGLVHKVADETDLRRNLISLTEKGKQIVDECQTILESVEARLFDCLSKQEREQLKTLFLRIVSNLETLGGKPPAPPKNEIQSEVINKKS